VIDTRGERTERMGAGELIGLIGLIFFFFIADGSDGSDGADGAGELIGLIGLRVSWKSVVHHRIGSCF